MLSVYVNIVDAWKDFHDAIGVLCALSKAFACFIILWSGNLAITRRQPRHGMAGRDIDLLKSYLSSRVQKVDINDSKSSGSALAWASLKLYYRSRIEDQINVCEIVKTRTKLIFCASAYVLQNQIKYFGYF